MFNLKNTNTLRKYIFPILLISGLIIGNLICYTENSRFLKPTTNMVIVFLIVASFIRSKDYTNNLK